MLRKAASFLVGCFLAASATAAEPVRLYAAGSLRVALTEVGAAFEKSSGIQIVNEFGASGLLRERIEKGAPAEVFASADMGHPQTLSRAGKSGPVTVFTRNRLCGLAATEIEATSANLLDVLLDPKVRVGSSTPKNDPSGDYAWEMFEKADKLRPGAFKTLSGKALQLVGGRDTPPPPKNRSVYTELMAEKKADVFLTYCTNAILAQHESPGLKVVQLPDSLAVGADYGLTVLKGASSAAERYAKFILSEPAQAILAKHGFASPK
jgi:molybdenum ABC transporter molybdate-binding protein